MERAAVLTSCGSSYFVQNNTCGIHDNSVQEGLAHCLLAMDDICVPNIFIWTVVSLYVLYVLYQSKELSSNGSAGQLKVCSIFFLATLTIVHLTRLDAECYILLDGQTKSYVNWTQLSCCILTAMIVKLEMNKKWVTSVPRFLFWLFMLTGGCFHVYYCVQHEVYNKNMTTFVLGLAFVLGIVAHLVSLNVWDSFQEKPAADTGKAINPEQPASFISDLFLSWVTSYVRKDYTKLQEVDIRDLYNEDRCKTIFPPFDLAWKQETENSNFMSKVERLKAYRETLTKGRDSKESKKDRKPSLLWALFKAHGFKYVTFQIIKCVFELCQFASPLALEAQMKYFENRDNEPAWKGYVLMVAIFLIITAKDVLHTRFDLARQRQSFHMRMMLRITMFKKAMTITNESRRDKTTGEFVSLSIEDVDKFISSCNTAYLIVVTPIQVCLALYLLYCHLGMGAFVGLAIMLLLIPFNRWVGKKIHALEEEKAKVKDERVKAMNEILNGIKVLKLYAWEESFIAKVEDIRKCEVALYKWIKFCNACIDVMFRCIPFLVRIAGFLVFIMMGGHLDPATAFVTASLFNILNAPFSIMALTIPQFVQAHISLRRLNDFLIKADIPDDIVTTNLDADSAIQIQDGTFTWDPCAAVPTLTSVNLNVQKGQLVAIVGVVGSGKSSLLSAVLGEMDKIQGKVAVSGKLAYVSQEAWIQNAMLRDNILFGSNLEAERYHKVVKACALKEDLQMLPAGDKTEIGEKGVNLSGGQKQRVSLARAVYSNAEIFLLDDPLSAVDAHVGKHIFNKVIGHNGMLKNKTRVLVTHGVHWLPYVDNIIVMKDGRISECGSYKQLLSHNGAFAQFLAEVFAHGEEDVDDEVQHIKRTIFMHLSSLESGRLDDGYSPKEEIHCSSDKEVDSYFNSRGDCISEEDDSNFYSSSDSNSVESDNRFCSSGDCISDDEERKRCQVDDCNVAKNSINHDHGSATVPWNVYTEYTKAVGLGSILVFVLIFFMMLLARDFKSLWLGRWTGDALLANTSLSDTETYWSTCWMYLMVYFISGGLEVIAAFLFIIILQSRTFEAANELHSQLLMNVLRLPMSFFDTTPTGSIISRFSKDISSVDEMGDCLEGYIRCLGNIVMNLLMIMFIVPKIIFFILLVSLVYLYMQRLYLTSARQLQQWSSNHSSSVYSLIKEALSGTSTIRAFRMQHHIIAKLETSVENHMKFDLMTRCLSKWFSIRMTLLSQCVALVAGLILLWDTSIPPSMCGLILTYSTLFVHRLAWFVYHSAYTEQEIVSLERVLEYSKKQTEAAWKVPELAPQATWPQNGDIIMNDFKMRYREGLDLVLKGVNCHFHSGEKVGIVGRTGAGKSSLTAAFFRLVEAASGQIVVDDRQIASMGLHDLRTKITILPQEPLIFGGSLRMNLDPMNVKSTDELWKALKYSHLQTFVEGLPGNLDFDCGEGGKNLSCGQRQLVCLARTLLRKSKILLLDEATAAVDLETDELIQRTIRSEFKDCTVLTIAHRLNTVMDCDRVLVMDQGLVKEFNSPKNLLADPASVFYSLARDANLVSRGHSCRSKPQATTEIEDLRKSIC